MKKSYLMIAAVATLLASCAGNDIFKEVIEENETELIGFETFHDKSTKAAVSAPKDLTSANGGFGVYGFKHLNDRTATNGSINLSDVTSTDNVNYVTTIFDNVKVWYESSTTKTQGFTYEVPKYWDKTKYYTFFAYAPQVAKVNGTTTGIAFDQTTGKFTRNDILALQKVNSTSEVAVGSNNRTQYGNANEENAIDYLIAPYVHSQKSGATNQSQKSYDGKELTVGFTFSHILSKLNVTVQAQDESTGHEYSGVSNIIIDKLNITNLPNNDEVATYAQNKTDEVAGTWTPANYSTVLNIVAGDNATSADPLYVLDGGSKSGTTITVPTNYLNQQFHYFVAPNTPASGNKYTLNIDYTINYVDGTVEPFSRSIDLSTQTANFTTMEQNYIYNINVTIALNQIYFTVDAINTWAEQTTNVNVD